MVLDVAYLNAGVRAEEDDGSIVAANRTPSTPALILMPPTGDLGSTLDESSTA
jgi:hypothetical protein